MTATADPLPFYTQPGLMTDAGHYAPLLEALPGDVPSLVKTVQGLLLHIFWADRYGEPLSEARQQEVSIRDAETMLERIKQKDDRPLAEPRPLDRRLVGNCRDFSVLLVTFLRHKGIPARARCGFGTYFLPNHYEDHWVGEYWHAGEGRWIMADAQMDAFQQETLGLDFDPLDVPHDRFISGGHAWQMCRQRGEDPERFGIFDMHGLWFVRGNLIRDFLALNNIDLLPWDGWGLIGKEEAALTADDLALLDHVAHLTLAGDACLDEVRALYAREPGLTMPTGWPEG